MGKTADELRRAYRLGRRWCVTVMYASPLLGRRGDVLSTHRTYDLALLAAKSSGWYSFVSVDEITCPDRI